VYKKIHMLLCPSALGSAPPERPWRAASQTRQRLGSAVQSVPGWGRRAAHKRGKGTLSPAKLVGPSRDAVLASNVVFELFDDELLLDNNRLDEIANRDEADQPPMVQDRQVANPPLGYDAHAFLNALV
jgi:hypothetical protein